MDIKKIREQMLERIDKTDALEVKKVNRYCELLELDEKCSIAIEEDGGTRIVVENGSQRFIKTHPNLNDKVKINSQLIALEKSINFIDKEPPPVKTGGGLI